MLSHEEHMRQSNSLHRYEMGVITALNRNTRKRESLTAYIEKQSSKKIRKYLVAEWEKAHKECDELWRLYDTVNAAAKRTYQAPFYLVHSDGTTSVITSDWLSRIKTRSQTRSEEVPF